MKVEREGHGWLLGGGLGDARVRIASALALWFGCGRVPFAPGTAGSLGALPVYFVLRGRGPSVVLAAAVFIGLVGVWAAGIVADAERVEDPQIVVIDEVCGTLIALSVAPRTALGVTCGFLLFRLLDAWKPFPARAAERLPRGWGIVVDDVVAGVQAAIVLLALQSWGIV